MAVTIKDLLQQAVGLLKENWKNHREDPSKEAGLLLSWVLKKDLGYLYAHADTRIDNDKADLFLSCVRRRARFEPFAYITGECEFMGLRFNVNPSVLIPRADTELLAEAVIHALGQRSPFLTQPCFSLTPKAAYRALEIGTGSGCLAVSAAKHVKNVRIDALDISEGALKTAHNNAVYHGVDQRINFMRGDFLDKTVRLYPPYDIIFSNPPYIPTAHIPGLMPDVRDYEPHTALIGGEDGLIFYQALADRVSQLLSPQGLLAVECGYDQAQRVALIFSRKGMETLTLRDLSGIERVVLARSE